MQLFVRLSDLAILDYQPVLWSPSQLLRNLDLYTLDDKKSFTFWCSPASSEIDLGNFELSFDFLALSSST